MTALEMELAISNCFGRRQNLIVPKISWGLMLHECDILVMSKAGWLTEVEIKVTKADLFKDAKKEHGHYDKRIRQLYFAVPDELAFYTNHIPERAGIIAVTGDNHYCEFRRPAEINKDAKKLTTAEQFQVARLGALRIWTLKENLQKFMKMIDEVKRIRG